MGRAAVTAAHPRSTAGVTCQCCDGGRCSVVSILTRDQLRASHKATTNNADLKCFNPHPRSTAGVTKRYNDRSANWRVSILTRDQLRASLIRPLRIFAPSLFQSSPAINCGRHLKIVVVCWIVQSFNPHPRSTAGVTGWGYLLAAVKRVSILTRDQLRASLSSPCLEHLD